MMAEGFERTIEHAHTDSKAVNTIVNGRYRAGKNVNGRTGNTEGIRRRITIVFLRREMEYFPDRLKRVSN